MLKELYGWSWPEIRGHFPDFSNEVVGMCLKRLQKVSVRSGSFRRIQLCTRQREPYINLAVAAGTDFIISRDRDLLDLMK